MTSLLLEALAFYGLDANDALFLRHNENLTYRIAEKYLLRIHRPQEGIHAPSILHDRRCEAAFLAHLKQQGLPVQTFLPNLQGETISVLADGTAASLLTWLPGKDLTQTDLTLDNFRRIGSMAARLHQASRGFALPHARAYDAASCARMEDVLSGMAERYRLGHAQDEIFRSALRSVAQFFTDSQDENILIHCDLSLSNILQTPHGLVPIDFSMLGTGRPMTDFGMLIAGINTAAARLCVVEGYRAQGGMIRRRELEAGFIHGLLGAFVFHADTWPKEAWFTPRLERWNREMLIPFAEGRPLFDDNMNFTTI